MENRKRIIGFSAISEENDISEEKIDLENYDWEHELDKKEDEYEKFVGDLVDEVGHGYKAYLKEKKLRIEVQLELVKLKIEYEELKNELEELKNQKKD